MRHFGVTARGVRMPVIHAGDPLEEIIFDTVTSSIDEEHIQVRDGDIIGITESIVARAQKNYALITDIAKDVRQKCGQGPVGLIFPILSRNRFLAILQGIAAGVDELIIQLSYPSDEVGNALVSLDQIDEKGINPYTDSFDDATFRKLFGPDLLHPFTHCDYPRMYQEVGKHIKIIYSNQAKDILKYTKKVIAADIHTRHRTKRLLKQAGAEIMLGLDDILNHAVDGSGYNPDYGLLGSNFASEGKLKLFPRDSQSLVDSLQKRFFDRYQKHIEVLVYGDGAFKDPYGKIWELADPVVSPFFTKGLEGTPHELKFKLLADTKFAHLQGQEAKQKMADEIMANKQKALKEQSLGTTPRHLTDLIGSLCDLTSGSGDKGTPVIYIQGYFDTYADE